MIKALHARVGATATALVGRNGVVLFAEMPEGTYAETFAIMCATIFGAGAAANSELRLSAPERVVFECESSTTVIVGCGETALLVAVVDRSVDPSRALDEVGKVAHLLTAR
ncbi:MAG: roadblock/LC7 domain-containing protein [Thermoplasmata archaeon]